MQHAVAAVASRDKAKAEKFIQDNLPNGAAGQQAGLGKVPKPVAWGSYAELYKDPVSGLEVTLTFRMSTSSTLAPCTSPTTPTPRLRSKLVNMCWWRSRRLSMLRNGMTLSTLRARRSSSSWRVGVGCDSLTPAFWTRFQPAVQALYDKLHVEKAIGDILAVNSNFSVHNYKG